jgi:nitrogen-specific signal transduction histidine kinase
LTKQVRILASARPAAEDLRKLLAQEVEAEILLDGSEALAAPDGLPVLIEAGLAGELRRRLEARALAADYLPFLRGLAHELNNPLTGILGYSQLLAGSVPEGGEELQEIQTCALRCRDLVAVLSRCARADEPPAHVSWDQLAEDLNTLLQPLARRRNAELTVRADPDLPEMSARVWYLRGLVLKLARAAFERMADEGHHLLVELRREGAGVRLSVTVTPGWAEGPDIKPPPACWPEGAVVTVHSSEERWQAAVQVASG